jgi:hypothetical protein
LNGKDCETANKTLITTGIQGYDLVIVVKFEYKPLEDFLAAATYCQLDAKLKNRPNAGVLTINTGFLKAWDQEQWFSHLTTCIHELTHVLALHPDLFRYYVDKTGQVYGEDRILKQMNTSGYPVDILSVEPLISIAKKYYNCSNITGIALEGNHTKPAAARGHFNPTWALNELMAPRDNEGTVISEFTFGLFEATGWYQPDYRYVEHMTYGRNFGCSFLNETCGNVNTSSMQKLRADLLNQTLKTDTGIQRKVYEYCSQEDEIGCFPDYNFKGICQNDSSSVPCRYYNKQKLIACHDPNITGNPEHGEIYSRMSKCILATIDRNGSSSYSGRCYKTRCRTYLGLCWVLILFLETRQRENSI